MVMGGNRYAVLPCAAKGIKRKFVMNWMVWLTGLAIAFLCVVLGALIPNTASPLRDGVQAFHDLGLTTISGAVVAIAAVLISQRGLAKLQRQDHQRDLDTRKWETLIEKREEACRILECGIIDLEEIHLNIFKNSESSFEIMLAGYVRINKDFKNVSAIISLYFVVLAPHSSDIIRVMERSHSKLRTLHSRKVSGAQGPTRGKPEILDLEEMIGSLRVSWEQLLMRLKAVDLLPPNEQVKQ